MRWILYFVGGLVLADIIAATFIWPPEAATSTPSKPVVNAATQQGQDPWMVNERYNAPHRDFLRREMLKTLYEPWTNYCSADGHEKLVRSIDSYFEQRAGQAWSYENAYGKAARDFAVKAWNTTDDKRIERLISERYERGYVSLNELRPSARKALAGQIKEGRINAEPCRS